LHGHLLLQIKEWLLSRQISELGWIYLHSKYGLGRWRPVVAPVVGEDGPEVLVPGEALQHLRGPQVVTLELSPFVFVFTVNTMQNIVFLLKENLFLINNVKDI
jgi:hypothetical protein